MVDNLTVICLAYDIPRDLTLYDEIQSQLQVATSRIQMLPDRGTRQAMMEHTGPFSDGKHFSRRRLSLRNRGWWSLILSSDDCSRNVLTRRFSAHLISLGHSYGSQYKGFEMART